MKRKTKMDDLEKKYIENGKPEELVKTLSEKFPGVMTKLKDVLAFVGDDSDREGLIDTPYRIVKSWQEIFSGYLLDPGDILSTVFEDGLETQTDEIVMCKRVEFFSMCEHHMLPFFGHVHIGYLPNKKVVGLSKLARLVDCYAKRLQIQEKMTSDIANEIEKHLDADGVGVIIEAEHLCMKMRGVNKHNTSMVTSAMRGKFKDQTSTRSEFLSLIKS